MRDRVSRMAMAATFAAAGLAGCTDGTPWAYPTEPGTTAERPATITTEPRPVAAPPAYTAPRAIATTPAPTSSPPTTTYAPPRAVPVPVVTAPPPVAAAPRVVAAAPPRVVYPAPATVIQVPAATTVYVPARPMLTEKSGLIDIVLTDGAGRPDGVILKDKTLIRFSPAFALAMDPDRSRLAPGRPIVVRGTVAGGRNPMLQAVEMGTDIYSMVTMGY